MSIILCFGLATCGGDSGDSAKSESSDEQALGNKSPHRWELARRNDELSFTIEGYRIFNKAAGGRAATRSEPVGRGWRLWLHTAF